MGAAPPLANDFGPIGRTNDANALLAKLDFRLSPKHNASIKYNYTRSSQQNGTFDVDFWGRSANALENDHSHAVNGSLTSLFSSSLSNEFRFQISREGGEVSTTSLGREVDWRRGAARRTRDFLRPDEEHTESITLSLLFRLPPGSYTAIASRPVFWLDGKTEVSLASNRVKFEIAERDRDRAPPLT